MRHLAVCITQERIEVIQNVVATFKNGAFVPDEPCDLPENTRVQVIVPTSSLIPPTITDDEERRRILARIAERMKNNPIPDNAPTFTREELHERR